MNWHGPLAVSEHALERFRERYPAAGERDLLRAVEAGEIQRADLVAAVTGRQPPPRSADDVYLLSPDGGVIFVVKPAIVVTALRLGRRQQRILRPEAFAGGG